MNQADFLRLLGSISPAGEEHFFGVGQSYSVDQTHDPIGLIDYSQFGRGKTHLGVLRSDAEVAGHGQIAPRPEGVTVDHGYDRIGKFEDGLKAGLQGILGFEGCGFIRRNI